MPNRQEQLEALVTEALGLPAEQREAFLQTACSDASMLDEATRTLHRLHDRTGKPTVAAVGDALLKRVQAAERIGQQIGVFRIERRLGAGGMGEVFLAHDTRLGRQVALKFVPQNRIQDEQTMRRFEQEARAASALNHPNILTIYEVGELNGERYLASEFVDGVTLRTELRRGGVTLGDALDIAIQVASALVASHHAGIVHRDLKPTNIMIRPDGYVKVIDFGLAKLTQAGKESTSVSAYDVDAQTTPGSLMGTVGYMSPEQARGEEVDHRTDLWSLGVMLYEMLAGRRPFEGETDSHVMVAIMEKPAPGLDQVPPGLEKILQLALMKDRDRRYQTADAMLADLREIRQSLDLSVSTRRLTAVPAPPRRRLGRKLLAVAAAVLAVAVGSWWAWRSYSASKPEFFEAERRQLTYNGHILHSVISPNGQFLANAVGESGVNQAVTLRRIGARAADDVILVPPDAQRIDGMTFSPDSRSLYFVTKARSSDFGKLSRVALGQGSQSAPEDVLEDIDGPISFSPDGKEFAFVRFAQQPNSYRNELVVASATDTSRVRVLATKQGLENLGRRVAWSERGDVIACVVYAPAASGAIEARVDLVPVDLRNKERVVPMSGFESIGNIAWLNEGRDLVAAMSLHGETIDQAQIRTISVATGSVRRVSDGSAGYRGVSLSQDRSRLVSVRLQTNARIWLAPANNWSEGAAMAAQLEPAGDLAWAPDGQVVFSSSHEGRLDLWLGDPKTSDPKPLTTSLYADRSPAWIPGTRSLVFSSNRTGAYSLWRLDVPDNHYLQLTTGKYDDQPSVSPDGKQIVYTAWQSGRPTLWRVAADGGRPERLTTLQARAPQYSPDGTQLLCEAKNDSPNGEWHFVFLSATGGTVFREIPISAVPLSSHARWMPTGRALAFVRSQSGVSNLWAYDLETAKTTRLTDFREDQILNFAWSPDGRQVAFIRGSLISNAFLFLRKIGN
ncbi:MAG: protein kinase [Bryobacteraceae bacterium]